MTFAIVAFIVIFVKNGKLFEGLELKRVESEEYGTWGLRFSNSKVAKTITIKDIMSCMKEENLVATSYQGKSNLRAKEVGSISASYYWTEWTRLREINHPNVVKFLAMCRSEKCFVSSAYVAPETKGSKLFTEKGDFYGFGLVLIELLTGRSPCDDAELGVHESVVEWARYCYSDSHLQMWVDHTIINNNNNNNNNDNQALMNINYQNNQIVETMNLALQCTAADPATRPSADELVKIMESFVRSSSCLKLLFC